MPKTRFPRVIHRIWVGSNPIPERMNGWWETWGDMNPEWVRQHWGNAEVEALMDEVQIRDFYDWLPRPVLKADVARLAILWKHGGLYVDTDYECRRGIEPLVLQWEREARRMVLTYEWRGEGQFKFATNAIIFSVVRHEALKWLSSEMQRRVQVANHDRTLNPMVLTGPRVWQAAVDKFPESIHLADHRLLMPFCEDELDKWPHNSSRLVDGLVIPDTCYAVHHFAGSWMRGKA